jgi:hypothetical protein
VPVKSESQRRLMEAVRHNPAFAKKVGISKAVAEKFVGPKAHNDGGAVKEPEMKESPAMMKKEVAFMKKKGAPKSMIKHEKAEAKGKGYARGGGIESKGKTKGKMVKMMGGGKC